MAEKLARGLRRIVVDGQPFVWVFGGGFRAFAPDLRNSPLHIKFPRDSVSSGSPYVPGHVIEARVINLLTPVWAATLIRYGLAQGWQPNESNTRFVIEDGIAVLTELDFKPTG